MTEDLKVPLVQQGPNVGDTEPSFEELTFYRPSPPRAVLLVFSGFFLIKEI